MELMDAIHKRKSIRGYKPDPVSREILEKVLSAAQRAPSAMNTQPWEFFVLTGSVLDALRKENVEWLRAGADIQPEHLVVGWPNEGIFRQRQVGVAKQLFQLMDIPREDVDKRAAWMERGFRYFDAPAAIIVLCDKSLSKDGPLMDIGAVMQNICLAAMEYGLGTCIEDQGVMYPKVLRKIAAIPDDKRIMMSIAIGYPDPDFPANQVQSEREPLEKITTWFGFE